jgi:hypothetical protein
MTDQLIKDFCETYKCIYIKPDDADILTISNIIQNFELNKPKIEDDYSFWECTYIECIYSKKYADSDMGKAFNKKALEKARTKHERGLVYYNMHLFDKNVEHLKKSWDCEFHLSLINLIIITKNPKYCIYAYDEYCKHNAGTINYYPLGDLYPNYEILYNRCIEHKISELMQKNNTSIIHYDRYIELWNKYNKFKGIYKTIEPLSQENSVIMYYLEYEKNTIKYKNKLNECLDKMKIAVEEFNKNKMTELINRMHSINEYLKKIYYYDKHNIDLYRFLYTLRRLEKYVPRIELMNEYMEKIKVELLSFNFKKSQNSQPHA